MIDANDVKFGKKVLPVLATAMYADPFTLFREYVQNAVDSIDDACRVFKTDRSAYSVLIKVDAKNRSISIDDNAIGIKVEDVKAVLLSIGDSQKDPKVARGRFGIGRLGGLGYCDKLVFETSAKGEARKSRLEWDAKKLRELLADPNEDGNAQDVLAKVTLLTEDEEVQDVSYFRVRLEEVSETTRLLDVDEVRKYLENIAPLEYYKPKFKYREKIIDYANENGFSLPEYQIFLSDGISQIQLHKPYEHKIKYRQGGKEGKVCDIVIDKLSNENGDVIAWYWYGVNDIKGIVLSPETPLGIRIRSGNIQIGSDDFFAQYCTEDRFTNYFIGEIHVIDTRIQPTGQRDSFVDSVAFAEFKLALKLLGKKLSVFSRYESELNAQFKNLEDIKHKKDTLNNDVVLSEVERKSKQAELDEKEKTIREKINRKINNSSGKIQADSAKKRLESIDRSFEEKQRSNAANSSNKSKSIESLLTDSEKDLYKLVYEVLSTELKSKDRDRVCSKIRERLNAERK